MYAIHIILDREVFITLSSIVLHISLLCYNFFFFFGYNEKQRPSTRLAKLLY